MNKLFFVLTLIVACNAYTAEAQAPIPTTASVKKVSFLASLFSSNPLDIREPQPPEPETPPAYATIGEEIPPANIRGTTYNRGEIRETTIRGQISTGLQWIWGIARDVIGK
jgi:hypothetical protein